MPSKSKRAARLEQERLKAKKKRITTVVCIAAAVFLIAALIVTNVLLSSGTEVYTDGQQTITLRPNGTFTAKLAHNVRYRGKYTREENTIVFSADGQYYFAYITGDVIHPPEEWDDGHGHGGSLTKK